jgi:hypothetical protein
MIVLQACNHLRRAGEKRRVDVLVLVLEMRRAEAKLGAKFLQDWSACGRFGEVGAAEADQKVAEGGPERLVDGGVDVVTSFGHGVSFAGAGRAFMGLRVRGSRRLGGQPLRLQL